MSDEKHPVEPDILRFRLGNALPYYMVPIYRLKPIAVKGLGTFAVDARWRWYYDEDGVPFDQDEQLVALYHEINHLLRGHHARCGDRNPKQFNVAGDLEINDWFPEGWRKPPNLMYPDKFKLPEGELAEWYYPRIDKWELHAMDDAGACLMKDFPNCKGQADDREPDVDPVTHEVKQKGLQHMKPCGPMGDPDDSPETGDAEADGYNVSEIEAEAIRRNVAEEVAKQKPGSVPAGVARWADEYLNPTVPWSKILKTVARRASIIIMGHTEQTYQKPSRRGMKPFILPKRIARKVVTAFYIDTSGSIGNDELAQGMAEVMAAVRTGTSTCAVTFVDAKVYEPTSWVNSPGEVKRIEAQGGGGTDMRLCFDHANTLRPKPNLLVIMTDGYTPWPEEEPHQKTIVVLTKNNSGPTTVPDWAKVVEMQ